MYRGQKNEPVSGAGQLTIETEQAIYTGSVENGMREGYGSQIKLINLNEEEQKAFD